MSRPSVESTLFRARRRLSEEYEELVSGERCRRIQAIIADAAAARGRARRAQDGAPRLLLPAVPARRARRGLRRRRARPRAPCARRSPRCCRCRRSSGAASPATRRRRGRRDIGRRPRRDAGAALDGRRQLRRPGDARLGQGRRVAAAVAVAVVGAGVAGHDAGLLGATPRDERPAAAGRAPAAPPPRRAPLTTRPAARRHAARLGRTGGSATPSSTAGGRRRPRSGSGAGAGAGSSSGSRALTPRRAGGRYPLSSATKTKPPRRDRQPGDQDRAAS